MLPLFVLGAALSQALLLDAAVAVVGNKVADKIEARRLARLLREIDQDLVVMPASTTAVDAWVLEECGPAALDPLEEVRLGGRRLWATSRQRELVVEYLDDEDVRRLRPLLTKLVVQSQGRA